MGILEAIKEIKVMSLNKRMRLHYEARMKEIRDKHAREEYVRDEGIALGKQAIILNMLKKGKSIEEICELTESTPELVEEVRSTLS